MIPTVAAAISTPPMTIMTAVLMTKKKLRANCKVTLVISIDIHNYVEIKNYGHKLVNPANRSPRVYR